MLYIYSVCPRDHWEKLQATIAIATMITSLLRYIQVPDLFAPNLSIEIIGYISQDLLYANCSCVGFLVD